MSALVGAVVPTTLTITHNPRSATLETSISTQEIGFKPAMSVSDTASQWLPIGAIHARLQGATVSPFGSEHARTRITERDVPSSVCPVKHVYGTYLLVHI